MFILAVALEPAPLETVEPQPPPAVDTQAELEALRKEVGELRARLNTVEIEQQRRAERDALRRQKQGRYDANQRQWDRMRARDEERKAAAARQSFGDRLAELERIRFAADFRFRVEHDWDSRNDDGSYRTDRFRLRYRARIGVRVQASDHIHFSIQTRTGVPTNMQSPHVNVGYNGFGLAPINLSHAYVRGDYRYFWWWLGKNQMPLWRQNELFWDNDVTPEGAAVGGTIPLHSAIEFRPTVAYFVPDHEQVVSYPDSRMVAGQLAFAIKAGERVKLNVASSYLHMQRLFEVPQHLSRDLWDQGGEVGVRRDRQFVYSSVGAVVDTEIADYALPFSVGFDHSIDVHDNRGSDLLPDHYERENQMYIAQLRVGHTTSIGSSSERGDWYVGYTFAWKEYGSVVSYYGEDDWVRWGNIHRNRNTNYMGHEIRAAVALGPRIDLLWRLYLVEALVPRLENQAIALESGNRTRLDLNVRF